MEKKNTKLTLSGKMITIDLNDDDIQVKCYICLELFNPDNTRNETKLENRYNSNKICDNCCALNLSE